MNAAFTINTYRHLKKTWPVTLANHFAEPESKSGEAFLQADQFSSKTQIRRQV